MDVSVHADVECTDGLCGQSTYIIVDPVRKQVTHLVVKERTFPHVEYLVPLDLVVESTPDLIRLHCTRDELPMQDSFTELEFVSPIIVFNDEEGIVCATKGIAIFEVEIRPVIVVWVEFFQHECCCEFLFL